MLISCKCLNFIASSNSQQQWAHDQPLPKAPPATANNGQQASVSDAATADPSVAHGNVATHLQQTSSAECNIATKTALSSSGHANNNATGCINAELIDALRQAFLQKYPRSFVFYSECVDFFTQAIGPLSDLSINALNQRDLIYSLSLNITAVGNEPQKWQLCLCSNCNVVLCAKRLSPSTEGSGLYLVNSGILTNTEELSQRRSDKSYSDTFGILIMDQLKPENTTISPANSQLAIGSLSTSFATSALSHLDSKQLRLRQLQNGLQLRLQQEIEKTDERIQRYTEQQFALLKSFREKSEQEYQILASLIQCIPEQQANDWLERQPPSFELSSTGGNLPYVAARRRNTISGHRELNSNAPTTPTTTGPPSNIFVNKDGQFKSSSTSVTTPTSPKSAITTTISMRPVAPVELVSAASTLAGSVGSALTRKIASFDTPPATPEATPMSVGNSPTFRQQQQQGVMFVGQQSFQQQFPTPTIETADDCLFDLEGVDGNNSASSSMVLQNPPSPFRQQQQNVPQQLLPGYNNYNRSLSFSNQVSDNRMSDLDESDDAEEAEDALDLDVSSAAMPMPGTSHKRVNINAAANMVNFGKSLPIEIANSPMTTGRKFVPVDSEDDELDNNVDIAASIKALAKSVHGEAVFGDLPRPRLRSQI